MMKKHFVFLILALMAFSVLGSKAQLVGPVVSMTGNVFDQVKREPVTVFIMVTDTDGNRITATRSIAAQNGSYFLTGLKPGKKYIITLKHKNYLTETFDLEIANTNKYTEMSRDFLVKPKQQGAKIKMRVTPFELNKSKIRYGADFFLNQLAKTMKNNPNVNFTIKCFPDDNDNRGTNLRLTTDRAKSIKQFLADNGISESRIKVEGSDIVDPQNPPPTQKSAKGKRYIGPCYIILDQL